MYGVNVTKRLVAIQQEQRSQKVATTLNYGQLSVPQSTPQQTWSGNVANSNNDLSASWIATFQRTDGVNLPPYVEFAWSFDLARWHFDDLIAAGSITSVSGRDKRAFDQSKFVESTYDVGSNSVSWRIDIEAVDWWYWASNGTNVTLVVQAISMVHGSLTLERIL